MGCCWRLGFQYHKFLLEATHQPHTCDYLGPRSMALRDRRNSIAIIILNYQLPLVYTCLGAIIGDGYNNRNIIVSQRG